MAVVEARAGTESESRGAFPKLLRTVVLLVLVLALVDTGVRRFVDASGIAREATDIETPSALVVKAAYTARFPGRRVVLLGDSLVLGRAMAENGDREWRAHTLSAALERELASRVPGQAVLVMNMGMNGAVPSDLEGLVDALLPQKPDLIVMDVSLRSFSKDFAAREQLNSRAWLASGLRLTASGELAALPGERSRSGVLERFMTNNWKTYQLRDFLRWRWLDGEPRDRVAALRAKLEGKPAPAAADASEMLLMMKVRKRYSSANLDADNPQFQALVRTLHKLRDAGQRAVLFYATENPRLLSGLMDEARHAELLASLGAAIGREGGPTVSFIGPLADLPEADFLDHVHVDAQGYRIYAERLAAAIGP